MLPRSLYLTWHGLGTPPVGLTDNVCRYWHTAATFQQTLDMAHEIEAQTGAEMQFTFDDGNSTDHSVGLPLLAARKRTAIFFVCAGRIGKRDFLGAAQLKELAAAGMRIGCHGYDHLSWREATDATLLHELDDGRRAIEDVLGQAVEIASTPFGALDHRSVAAAKKAGFRALFASSGGFATAQTGLIPRNTIGEGFAPVRDLPMMAAWSRRAHAAFYDTARRVKYGFY